MTARPIGLNLRSHFWWPFALSSFLFLGIVALVIFRSSWICHGYFGYPIDDTYIHMAMAKNVAEHAIWGVTRYEFSSTTSSPLYTAVLSLAYLTTGVQIVTPLVLNVLAALLLIGFAAYLFVRAGLGGGASFLALVAIVLFTPLPAVAESGMEHTFHALFTIIFVHLSSQALTSQGSSNAVRDQSILWLLLLSPVLVMTRYEGVFLILTVSCLFAIQRNWKASVGLVSIGVGALAVYGWISVAHGWLALPNSVVLKANLPEEAGLFARFQVLLNWFVAGVKAPHVALLFVFLLMLLYATLRQTKTIWTYSGVGLIQFLIICLLHLDLARTGWFYRYEAYLITLGVVTSAIALHNLNGFRRSAIVRGSYVVAAVAAALLGYKAVRSIVYAPRAIHNVYEQQYQMARFVGQFYSHDTILLNDIGAICFYTDAHVLDLFGLASMEPAEAKIHHYYNTNWLRGWARSRGASLAILYSRGWAGDSFSLPGEWPQLASWSISDNFILRQNSVELFALRPGSVPEIRSRVRQFGKELPAEVRQSGVAFAKAFLLLRRMG